MFSRKWITIIGIGLVLVALVALVPAVLAQGPLDNNGPSYTLDGTGFNMGAGRGPGWSTGPMMAGPGGGKMQPGTGPGFIDQDGDGVCDNFVDEDGDGVCDNAGQGGGRGAGFVDQDGDGVCDNFVDENGDGVCDNAGQGQGAGFVDEDGDGVCDHTGQNGGQGGRGNGRMSGRWSQATF